jgi:hypothetical protein
MLAKLVFVILTVGATASALLVNRQQRIETFHEMSLIHRRVLDHESTLWRMQSQIDQRTRPAEVRQSLLSLGGQWSTIPATPINPEHVKPLRVVEAEPARDPKVTTAKLTNKSNTARPSTPRTTNTQRSSTRTARPQARRSS